MPRRQSFSAPSDTAGLRPRATLHPQAARPAASAASQDPAKPDITPASTQLTSGLNSATAFVTPAAPRHLSVPGLEIPSPERKERGVLVCNHIQTMTDRAGTSDAGSGLGDTPQKQTPKKGDFGAK